MDADNKQMVVISILIIINEDKSLSICRNILLFLIFTNLMN